MHIRLDFEVSNEFHKQTSVIFASAFDGHKAEFRMWIVQPICCVKKVDIKTKNVEFHSFLTILNFCKV